MGIKGKKCPKQSEALKKKYSEGWAPRKGKPGPNLGKKLTEEQRRKISKACLGRKHTQESKLKMSLSRRKENNSSWKGDLVGYEGLHQWIGKCYGVPDHCDMCGLTKQPKGNKNNYFEWSCRTGIYSRDAKNWWQLCVSCHRRYDFHFLNDGKYAKNSPR